MRIEVMFLIAQIAIALINAAKEIAVTVIKVRQEKSDEKMKKPSKKNRGKNS